MKLEIRADGSAHLEGYVNAVGRDSRRLYDDWGCQFVEQISAGAFENSIKRNSDIGLMMNHEIEAGGVKAGNLELFEDNIGLFASCEINNAEIVNYITENGLTGWSFGFYCQKSHTEQTADFDVMRRIIDELDLVEVSFLSGKTPAYFGTSISARANEEGRKLCLRCSKEEVEIVDKREKKEERKVKKDFSFFNETIQNEIEIIKLKARV